MNSKKKKILIIDDDPDFVRSTKIVLNSVGYKVSQCYDSKIALSKVQQFKPDLIILDVMMDKDNAGFDIALNIRKLPLYSKIPILMITAIHQKTSLRFSPETDGEFLPVQELLDKPVPPNTLLKEIERFLENNEL